MGQICANCLIYLTRVSNVEFIVVFIVEFMNATMNTTMNSTNNDKGFKKSFCFTWIVTSFDVSCLDFYQNVKKVSFSWPKGQKRSKIVGVFGIENFLSILHFG